jgi:protein-tyrosine phosphatase
MEKPEDGERLIGVTQIWERLFLGSLYDAERLCRANPHAIGAVLSLSATLPCNTRREINYIHLHVEDAHAIPVDQFTAVMSAIAENIRCGRLLIHCGSGISRAPVIVSAYLHVVGYKQFDAALLEIAGLRPIIAPSAILLASVKEHLR